MFSPPQAPPFGCDLSLLRPRLTRKHPIHGPHHPERIPILQLRRQCIRREILIAYGPRPSTDGGGADARKTRIRGGGKGAAVLHRGADLDPGGKAVEDEPAGFAL